MRNTKKNKFKTFSEFLLAIKKESDSGGKIVDERLKLNKELIRPCPKHQKKKTQNIPYKVYYCNDCRAFWYCLRKVIK